MSARRCLLPCVLLLVAASYPAALAAATSDNVLVVINDASAESLHVGEHYRSRRGIPDANIVHLQTSASEEISRHEYERTIEAPIAAALSKARLQDRIEFIVLTTGIPIRIMGSAGRDGTVASVDSELALLYRKMVRGPHSLAGPVPNPYFSDAAAAGPRPFDRAEHDIYLVSRLDGFSVEDAIALVDRGAAPVADGDFVLKPQGGSSLSPITRKGNGWLDAAAARLREAGLGERVANEEPQPPRPVLGYYFWAARGRAPQQTSADIAFAPGAIAGLFAGDAARTFEPGPPTARASSRSLAAALVRAGATGVAGHVSEGYLDGTIRPDVLFPAYAAGLTLGEAFYRAMPYLSWQTIVLGDPLCAPFAPPNRRDTSAGASIDPTTELPAHFSRRRLEQITVDGIHPRALRLFLKAESRLARDDSAGAIEALRQAVDVSPTFDGAALRLALLLQQEGDAAAAADAYRLALEARPGHPIALNNLALLLADRGQLDEALALAEKAYAVAPRSADVTDTLGWILHLRGAHAEAARHLARAAAAAPGNAEIRLHAALVFLAAGDTPQARRELEAALSIDPSLGDRPEAKPLLRKLGDRRY